MQDVEELIAETKSENPSERISARIALLEKFPDDSDQSVKEGLYHELTEDVRSNREIAVGHVLKMSDVNSRAYAVLAVNYGLRVNRGEVPPAVGIQKEIRSRFVYGIESLVDELPKIENIQARVKVAEIIAREGHFNLALRAVDATWETGWDEPVSTLLYHTDVAVFQTVADNLEDTIKFARVDKVKERALSHLSKIPNEEEKEKRLVGIMCSNDSKMAVKATELYVNKTAPLNKNRAEVALEAIMARRKGFGGEVLEIASKAAVERAFELYLNLSAPEERLMKVYYFTTNYFDGRLRHREQKYPAGLASLVTQYLANHVDEAALIEKEKDRDDVLVTITIRGGGAAERAVDYLAQTKEPMDGVENIAQMYTTQQFMTQLHTNVQDKVKRWAIKLTRQYVNLKDKNLARKALHNIAGWPDDDLGGRLNNGDGMMYTEESSKEPYDAIATAELERLPSELTKDEKLKQAFS